MNSDSLNLPHNSFNQSSQAGILQSSLAKIAADLQALLQVEQVNVCQLQPDNQVHVVAEAAHGSSLPSLLFSSFPLDYFAPHSSDLLFQSQIGAMVNAESNTLFQIPRSVSDPESYRVVETMKRIPDGARVLQHLTEMRANLYVVVPIFHHEEPWGLLTAYRPDFSLLATRQLEVVQTLASQLSVAIDRDSLHGQVQVKAKQEKVLGRLATLLQSADDENAFQTALETTVAVFAGSGGRLCMGGQAHNPDKSFAERLAGASQDISVNSCGVQPVIPVAANSKLMEQYDLWQDHYSSGDYLVWDIPDLYRTPELQPLFGAFQLTPIRSLLMIPLVYRQQLQGYLSIFRNAADSTDLELAQKIGRQFAIALYERALSQQLHVSSDAQSTEAQLSTHQLLRVSQQQVGLSEMLAQLQTATDLTTFARATTKGICQLLAAERVSVYRFNDDWGGEYIHEFEYAKPEWIRTAKLGENTAWNDTFLQETQGGRYRNNETYVVDDIHQAGLASCHIDMLKQFEVQSFSTAPIFVNGQLWGVLAAYQHSAPRHWPTTDVFFLHQSATFLGLAFQSMPDDSLTGVQQQTQLERVIQQQTGLCGVLTQLQTAPDLTTIVRATTKEICDLIETERVAIYQFNDDWSGEFIHDYEYTTPEWQHPLKLGAETVWADTYIQETQGGRYRNNETYILDDIYQAGLSACFINVLEQFRVNALATAPIFVGNKLWGVLAAYHHSEPRHWSTADVLLLKQAATALGLALQHVPDSAHFTESEQQSQLERVEQHQSSLCEILTKLQTTTDLARIFRSTTKEICGSLGAERVSVYRFNENWGGAYIHDFEYAKAKWQRPFKLGTNTVWNDTYLQDTQGGRYRYNETYAVDDIHQAELSSCHVDILKQFEVQSFATAPVFVDEQLWGVIAAYQHSGPRHWSPTDVSFLHQVATALGLALYQDGLRSKAKAGRSGFDVSAAERGAWEESVAKLTYTDREG